MGQGYGCKQLDYKETTIAIDAQGAGELAVLFDAAYVSLPDVLVVQDEADEAQGAEYRVKDGTLSTTGLTLQVVDSARVSRNIKVIWIAHAKT